MIVLGHAYIMHAITLLLHWREALITRHQRGCAAGALGDIKAVRLSSIRHIAIQRGLDLRG
jgi:hypothetical protein